MPNDTEPVIERRFARKAPFPWHGGKSQAAPLVWDLIGDVEHYVEPFAGSLAVLLDRPHPCNQYGYVETVNDIDGFIVNAWRSIAFAPDEVAEAASWPVSESDKSAREIAILRWRDEVAAERLAGDAFWCDPVVAGWWLWAVAVEIAAFTGNGAWTADPVSGRIVKQPKSGRRVPGVARNIPFIGGAGGIGVNSPSLREPGVSDGENYHPTTMPKLRAWMALLSARLRHVRIINGDWTRVCTDAALHNTFALNKNGRAGIFLDPPYNESRVYSHENAALVAEVRQWCIEAGRDPRNRIVLAGYDTEHAALEAHGWSCHGWFVRDSMFRGGRGDHAQRERVWASPFCLALNRFGFLARP